MKHCSGCDQHLPHSCFHQSKKAKDSLYYRCKTCSAKARKKRYIENAEKERAYSKNYAETHPEWKKESNEKNYSGNTEARRIACRKWYQLNKGAMNAKTRKRQLRLRDASLANAYKDEIKKIYEHARDCSVVTGEPYHVDHIVPIHGENICGLHVPWNLQVLPAEVNAKKSNKV